MNKRQKILNGWILYSNLDSGINMHYVNLYRKACEKRGMNVRFGVYDPELLSAGLKACQIEGEAEKDLPQFVINRTRDDQLAERLESYGIHVFNSSFLTRLGNDKSEAYRYMQQRNVPIMPTIYGLQVPPHWYPAVVKSCDGHGGTEVFLLRNETEWEQWKASINQNKQDKQNRKRYVVQQAASCLGRDLRVYVVGNKIKAAVLRTSQTDFRSNYCLGGNVQMYQLSMEEQKLAEHVIQELSIGMAGIDFVFHKGRMIFNEIEDVAGARSLYSLTDYDIVDDYISYIQEELSYVKSSNGKTNLQEMSVKRSCR